MNKFPLKEDLHDFCRSIGIKDISVDSVCPPDYRFMYHWNISKQPTDDIIMRRVYSTTLSKDNDVFSFIEELYHQGHHSFDYKYFSSDDAIDGYVGLLGFNPLYDYCKSRGIGHARSYLSSEAGIIIQ